jgi:hypothetical protein
MIIKASGNYLKYPLTMLLFIKQNKQICALIILIAVFYNSMYSQGTVQQLYLGAGCDFSNNKLAGKINPLSYSTYSLGLQMRTKRRGAGFSIEHQRNYRISEYNWIGWGNVKQTEHYSGTQLRLLYAVKTKIGLFIPQAGFTYVVGHVRVKSTEPNLNMSVNASYTFNASIRSVLHIKYVYGLNSRLSIGGAYNHILLLPERFPYMKKTFQIVLLHDI